MALGADISLIVAAGLLDAWLGDPVYHWHPIRVLGRASLALEQQLFARRLDGYVGGCIHFWTLLGLALLTWGSIHWLLNQLSPLLAWAWDLYITYSLLCLRDLLVHGARVLDALNDPPQARRELAMLVGRDTQPLTRDGIVRATIESLAENLTDGVLTPIWALCLFGVPGLITVKVISSLDSMIGYRNARYHRFGWLSARADDLMHWLPARLSVPVVALAAGLTGQRPWLALSCAHRYHHLLPSPNSGWSEAAMAGALRIRLLGPIWHDNRLVNTLYLGDPLWPADLHADHLRRALTLIAWCGGIGYAFGFVGLIVFAVAGHLK